VKTKLKGQTTVVYHMPTFLNADKNDHPHENCSKMSEHFQNMSHAQLQCVGNNCAKFVECKLKGVRVDYTK
jgi:hypothetical protein